jgi:hypothetical protein
MWNEVHTVVKMSMLVFWVMTPCRLVGGHQHFGETYCLHLQGWNVSPKHWYLPMSPHSITTQNNNIDKARIFSSCWVKEHKLKKKLILTITKFISQPIGPLRKMLPHSILSQTMFILFCDTFLLLKVKKVEFITFHYIQIQQYYTGWFKVLWSDFRKML